MNNRDSRFELLRVVAIFFVVVHHLLLFGVDACGYLSDFSPSPKGVVGAMLNSVVVTGVSLFVMITGWFGVRRVWRPMLRLILVCAVFGAVAFGVSLALRENVAPNLSHSGLNLPRLGLNLAPAHWSRAGLWDSMKFTNWWFMAHYLMLLLWAPLLEAAFAHIDRRGMERVVVCLLVFNIVFGYWWGYVNTSGYNVIHFILLYVLARYMRLYSQAPVVRFIRVHALAIALVCAVLMTAIFLFSPADWPRTHTPIVWNYNDPLVILEALAIFSLFAKSKFPTITPSTTDFRPVFHIYRNNTSVLPATNRGNRTRKLSARINFVAKYVLGIYLLQSAPALVFFRNALGYWAFNSGCNLLLFANLPEPFGNLCGALCGYVCLLLLAIVLCVICWFASWGLMSLVGLIKPLR